MFAETIYKRFQEGLFYTKTKSIDTDDGMYLTVDFLIEINKIITCSNNITLR